MGNHRLILACPQFALSPQSSKNSYRDKWGKCRDDDRPKFHRRSDIRFQGPAAEALISDAELLEMDLDDWMNVDHFPPLSSSTKNPLVAIGVMKQSKL
jgi:hypothetical protein